jgi:hypothetical protein
VMGASMSDSPMALSSELRARVWKGEEDDISTTIVPEHNINWVLDLPSRFFCFIKCLCSELISYLVSNFSQLQSRPAARHGQSRRLAAL